MLDHLTDLLTPIYFYLFAGVALLTGSGLLICRHPLSGALNLIGVMISLAGIYAIIGSPFLAVLQVLVYAGAIMMLVVFVIMVLNQARDTKVPRFDGLSLAGAGLVVAVGFLLIATLINKVPHARQGDAVRGDVAPMAKAMFDLTAAGPGYYLLFEIVGVLLLGAIVSAVLLAKRRLDHPVDARPTSPAEDDHAAH